MTGVASDPSHVPIDVYGLEYATSVLTRLVETVCRLRQISTRGNACAILTPPTVKGCLPGSRCGAPTAQGDVSTDFVNVQVTRNKGRLRSRVAYYIFES